MSEPTVRVSSLPVFIDGLPEVRCDIYPEHECSAAVSFGAGMGRLVLHGTPDVLCRALLTAAEAVRPHITTGLERHLLFGWPDDVVPVHVCELRNERPATGTVGPLDNDHRACDQCRGVEPDPAALCDVCGIEPAVRWLSDDVHACAVCADQPADEVPADEQAVRDAYAANPPRVVQSWCPQAGNLTEHERLDDGRLRCLTCGEIQTGATKVPA